MPSTAQTKSTSIERTGVISPGFTYLQTAQVWVTEPTGLSRLTRVLDGGMQSRFIMATLIVDVILRDIYRRELTVAHLSNNPPNRVRVDLSDSI